MKEFKYRIGQAVRTIKDLDINKIYFMKSGAYSDSSSNGVAGGMLQYAGRIVHIRDYWSEKQYRIEEDNGEYLWTDEMFEEKDGNCIFHGLI